MPEKYDCGNIEMLADEIAQEAMHLAHEKLGLSDSLIVGGDALTGASSSLPIGSPDPASEQASPGNAMGDLAESDVYGPSLDLDDPAPGPPSPTAERPGDAAPPEGGGEAAPPDLDDEEDGGDPDSNEARDDDDSDDIEDEDRPTHSGEEDEFEDMPREAYADLGFYHPHASLPGEWWDDPYRVGMDAAEDAVPTPMGPPSQQQIMNAAAHKARTDPPTAEGTFDVARQAGRENRPAAMLRDQLHEQQVGHGVEDPPYTAFEAYAGRFGGTGAEAMDPATAAFMKEGRETARRNERKQRRRQQAASKKKVKSTPTSGKSSKPTKGLTTIGKNIEDVFGEVFRHADLGRYPTHMTAMGQPEMGPTGPAGSMGPPSPAQVHAKGVENIGNQPAGWDAAAFHLRDVFESPNPTATLFEEQMLSEPGTTPRPSRPAPGQPGYPGPDYDPRAPGQPFAPKQYADLGYYDPDWKRSQGLEDEPAMGPPSAQQVKKAASREQQDLGKDRGEQMRGQMRDQTAMKVKHNVGYDPTLTGQEGPPMSPDTTVGANVNAPATETPGARAADEMQSVEAYADLGQYPFGESGTIGPPTAWQVAMRQGDETRELADRKDDAQMWLDIMEGRFRPTVGSTMAEQLQVDQQKKQHPSQMYKAPPGMEHVVKRLKTKKDVKNPYAVAWSMHDDEKEKHGIAGIEQIGPLENAYRRGIRAFDYISKHREKVPVSVIERFYQDAITDLDRLFPQRHKTTGFDLHAAWKHVLDSAKEDAMAYAVKSAQGFGQFRYADPGVPESAFVAINEKLAEDEYSNDEVQEEVTGEGSGIPKRNEDGSQPDRFMQQLQHFESIIRG